MILSTTKIEAALERALNERSLALTSERAAVERGDEEAVEFWRGSAEGWTLSIAVYRADLGNRLAARANCEALAAARA